MIDPSGRTGPTDGESELTPETALATYGTLMPGEINHHIVRPIDGEWIEAAVRGYLFDIGWGAADGFPGIVPAADGNLVPVAVLRSDRLDRHWRDLDRFEGPGYRRSPIEVMTRDGATSLGRATIYEALTDND